MHETAFGHAWTTYKFLFGEEYQEQHSLFTLNQTGCCIHFLQSLRDTGAGKELEQMLACKEVRFPRVLAWLDRLGVPQANRARFGRLVMLLNLGLLFGRHFATGICPERAYQPPHAQQLETW